MHGVFRRLVLAALVSAGLAPGAVRPATAAVLVTILESGDDVVIRVSGSANTAALTRINDSTYRADINAVLGILGLGTRVQQYTSLVGSQGLGPGTSSYVPIMIADVFGSFSLSSFGGSIGLPLDYVSGTEFTAGMTILDADLSTKGLTAGTYTWNWGSGAAADSLTLEIGSLNVPEPLSAALLGSRLLGLAALRRRPARG